MTAIARKLAILAQLGWRERLLTVEAMAQLIAARTSVSIFRSRSWRDTLLNQHTPHSRPVSDGTATATIARSIERAARNLPGKTLCLPKALTGRAMLNRRNIPNEIGVGVRIDTSGKHDFHAWVMVDGRFVTGAHDAGEYRQLTSAHSHSLINPSRTP